MNENWTHKKVKDVCEKASSNIVLNKFENNVGDYALYGASGLVKGVDFYHRDEPYIGIVKDGSGVGRVDVYPAKSSLVGTMQYILPKIDCSLKFLCYALQSLKLSDFVTGAAIPHIYFRDYGECVIPVPPLATQSRIVSELDLLQSIIDKQKAQLKELDNLAQAIFYDMFGNPMENVQGWEQEKLGDMCEVTSSKRVYQSEWKTTGVPFYRISDFSQLIENKQFNSELYISMDKYYELKRNNQVPVAGDILVTSRGTLGNCYIVKYDDCFYFQDGMITWLKNINNRLHPLFLTFLFKNSSFRKQIEKNQSGSTVAYLSISMLKKFALPVPPLPLQQSFATKIESTEKQKAAIGKSIEETQKLFDYTMDKYFG